MKKLWCILFHVKYWHNKTKDPHFKYWYCSKCDDWYKSKN